MVSREPNFPAARAASLRFLESRQSTLVLLAAVYVLIVFGMWALPPPRAGWAAGDASDYHFPIINYFVKHGFDLHYPPDLIAMFPGMHMFFAFVARICGLHELPFPSLPAILIQSIFGMLLLLALFRVARSIAGSRFAITVLVLPVLSSSYVLYSWVWPTTDLGSLALYAWILALLIDTESPTLASAGAQSLLAAASIFFRQSYAVLSLASLASIVVRAMTHRHERLSLPALALTMAPVIVAVVCISLLIAIWGGIVPPGFHRHMAGTINIVSAVHILALSGIIGWPFALPLCRSLSSQPRRLWTIVAVSLTIAAVCCLFLPLEFNVPAGRYNSLVWNVPRVFLHQPLGTVFVGLAIAIGCFLWVSIFAAARRDARFPPELIMFSLFSASLLVQQMSWQRYVEPELLLTLGVRFARDDLNPNDARVIIGSYSLYGGISIVHAFSSSGIFKI